MIGLVVGLLSGYLGSRFATMLRASAAIEEDD